VRAQVDDRTLPVPEILAPAEDRARRGEHHDDPDEGDPQVDEQLLVHRKKIAAARPMSASPRASQAQARAG
jgi:hypothetical protein